MNANSNEIILQIKELEKRFDETSILSNLSLEVKM